MAIIALLAMSCGQGELQKEAASDSTGTGINIGNIQELSASDTLPYNDSVTVLQSGGAPIIAADWDKKLVKTAHLNLELHNYDSFDYALHHQLKSFGAYIASEKQERTESTVQNTLTIKVPVAQFESLLGSLNGRGILVKEKEITAEDVTTSIIDTKARTEAKKIVRARYLELMKESRKMDDVLTIQDQLNNVQQTIENNTGHVNQLEQQAAYSTINLSYYQPNVITDVQPDQPGYGWQLFTSFTNGLSIIGNVLLFIVAIWPFAIIGIVAWLYFSKRRNHLKTQKSIQDA
ncbi:hypothetical protein FLA_2394 [Filimonas lacunae]|nr:hypothetical protein FLA_2394 [Filimonas lacunae]